VKGHAVAHRAGSGRVQDVEQIGMVPGRHGVGDHQTTDRQPDRQAGADVRGDQDGEAHEGESAGEVGHFEIEERDQQQAGVGDVDPVAGDAVARRQEQDQRQDAEQAPAVAVVRHGEGVGVRLVADIRRHQHEQGDEDHEEGGGQNRQAAHRRDRSRGEGHSGHDGDADQEGEGRRPDQFEAEQGQHEVELAHRLMEVDMCHVAVLQVPGAGEIVEEVPGHLVRQDETRGEEGPQGDKQRHARQQREVRGRRIEFRSRLRVGQPAFGRQRHRSFLPTQAARLTDRHPAGP
jgi:hypothetical protein